MANRTQKRKRRKSLSAKNKDKSKDNWNNIDVKDLINALDNSAQFDVKVEYLPDEWYNVQEKIGIPKIENDSFDYDLEINENEDRKDLLDGSNKSKTLTNKIKKNLNRPTIAQLKQVVDHPEVLEEHDTSALDPIFLVYLKSYRNSVQVSRHWCLKRKYLQGKRGMEKKEFSLPPNVKKLGIHLIRDINKDRMKSKNSSTNMREKINPKTYNNMTIDYQSLYNCFFKYNYKPKISSFGDLYHENKEFEFGFKTFRPGFLSKRVKDALGMTALAPPPWLINMQRFGPPPSYPNLRIPGLNAPIPKGANWGYNPGCWGEPPTDINGRPLYGDVYGDPDEEESSSENSVREILWGEMDVYKTVITLGDLDDEDSEIKELTIHDDAEIDEKEYSTMKSHLNSQEKTVSSSSHSNSENQNISYKINSNTLSSTENSTYYKEIKLENNK